MRFRFTLLLCLIPFATSAQNSGSAVKSKPLAIAKIVPAKHAYKLGEPIKVTLLLEAGSEGVYISKSWGSAGSGIPGFFVRLETASGKPAQTCGAAADALLGPEPDPRDSLQRDFVHLRQGELVGWKTIIDCPLPKRGRYRILASYSPWARESVASLPESKGLVLRQLLDAKPVEIAVY